MAVDVKMRATTSRCSPISLGALVRAIPAKGCQVKAIPVREILEPASLVSKTPAAKCFFEL